MPTVKELRIKAKSLGLKGFWKLRKVELEQLVSKYDKKKDRFEMLPLELKSKIAFNLKTEKELEKLCREQHIGICTNAWFWRKWTKKHNKKVHVSMLLNYLNPSELLKMIRTDNKMIIWDIVPNFSTLTQKMNYTILRTLINVNKDLDTFLMVEKALKKVKMSESKKVALYKLLNEKLVKENLFFRKHPHVRKTCKKGKQKITILKDICY